MVYFGISAMTKLMFILYGVVVTLIGLYVILGIAILVMKYRMKKWKKKEHGDDEGN